MIFCLDQRDCGIFEVLAPLYFPRNHLEETSALWQLPKNLPIGISGELSISDRQIRITRNPQHTIMIGSEFSKNWNTTQTTTLTITKENCVEKKLNKNKLALKAAITCLVILFITNSTNYNNWLCFFLSFHRLSTTNYDMCSNKLSFTSSFLVNESIYFTLIPFELFNKSPHVTSRSHTHDKFFLCVFVLFLVRKLRIDRIIALGDVY